MPLASWPAALPMAALIQLAGSPLAGGVPQGSATLPLERAAGGDTPVLRFDTLVPATAPNAGAGRGQARLLLDSGASTTMVSPALAARLGLATWAVTPESFALAGGGQGCGTLAPRRTRLPDLRLSPPPPEASTAPGALLLRGVEALVLPVAALPAGIDGVLGAPTLRQMPILIDPPAGRLVLGPAALAGAPALPPTRRIPLRWRHGVPLLTLASRRGPVQALADTGAEGLFLSPSLASRLEPLGPAEPLRLVGVCGEQAVRRQRFRGLALPAEMGGGDPARPTAAAPGTTAEADLATPLEGIVTDTPVFGGLGVEAIVGQEWLRQRRQLWRLDSSPPELLLW